MSILRYPTPDDLARYESDLKVPQDAIVRDISRLVTICYLVERGYLKKGLCVIAGGMGLRLRGSPRFTMRDTDTSRRGAPDELELVGALTINENELEVIPDRGDKWQYKKQLAIAQPIEYVAYFAEVGGNPPRDYFQFTQNWRGLEEDGDELELRHPYDELELPHLTVPVMDLTEQTAEKLVAWCIHGLMKHYVDAAWIAFRLYGELRDKDLARLVKRKLDVGANYFPEAYAGFVSPVDLIPSLLDPDRHHAPLSDGDDKAAALRFSAAHLNKAQATALIREKLVPLLS